MSKNVPNIFVSCMAHGASVSENSYTVTDNTARGVSCQTSNRDKTINKLNVNQSRHVTNADYSVRDYTSTQKNQKIVKKILIAHRTIDVASARLLARPV